MTTTTTTMSLFLRGTAILALTVAGAAANAEIINITDNDDAPGSTINDNDEQSANTLTSDPADGGIENTVTLTGNYGGDAYVVKAFENVDVEVATPDLDIKKVATIETAGGVSKVAPAGVGDVITYTYTVKNTGNVTMEGLWLSDSHNGSGALSTIACTTITQAALPYSQTDTEINATDSWKIVKLGAQDTVVCSATYTVTQADVDGLQNP